LGGLVVVLIILLLVSIVTLQVPSCQTYLAQKAASYLSEKIKAKVALGGFAFVFPKSIEIKDLMVEDRTKDTLLEIHSLKLKINIFDLFTRKIDLEKIEINQMRTHIHRLANDLMFNYSFILTAFSSEKPNEQTRRASWKFSIENISLKDILFNYRDTYNEINVRAELGLLTCSLSTFDMSKQVIAINQLSVSGNNSFGFENGKRIKLKEGFDPGHFRFSGIQTDCRDLYLSFAKTSLNIQELQFQEKCGLNLKHFRTRLSYDSTDLKLDGFGLKTDKSELMLSFSAHYHSLNTSEDFIEKLFLKAKVQKSVLALSDVLLAYPDLLKQKFFAEKHNTLVHFQSDIIGTIDQFQVNLLELATGTNTLLRLKGLVRGISDPEKFFADLNLLEFETGKMDLESISPEYFPSFLSVPAFFQITGHIKGYVKNFDADLVFNSTVGKFKATIKMNPIAGNQEQPYIINVETKDLNLSKMLSPSYHLGSLSLVASLKGEGYTSTTFRAKFTGQAFMDGKALAFLFDGKIDLDGLYPQYAFKLDLKNLDLQALHFSEKAEQISGTLLADLHKNGKKNITGKITFVNGLLLKNNKRYLLDSILLTSGYKGDTAEIRLRSVPVKAYFRGEIHVDELSDILTRDLNTYFPVYPEKGQHFQVLEKFDFDIHLRDSGSLVSIFIPGFQELSPSVIKGSYDSEAKKLELSLNIPQLIYKGVELDSMSLNVNTNKDQLNYSLRCADIFSSLLKTRNVFFGGDVRQKEIHYYLNTLNNDSSKMLSLGGIFNYKDGFPELRFSSELILNNATWKVDPINYIRFEKNNLFIHQLAFSNGEQEIFLNSIKNPQSKPELRAEFRNFSLSTISKIIENKDSLIKGIVNGTFIVKEQRDKIGFISDMTLKDLVCKKIPLGDMNLHIDNQSESDQYDVKLNVSGNQNDLNLNGNYTTGMIENKLDLMLDIRRLNLGCLEPFVFHQMKNLSGLVNGKLKVSGTTEMPDISGYLNVKNAGLNPEIIGSYMKIDSGSLVLESGKVKFNSFELKDSSGKPGIINGYVDIRDFKNLRFDLNLKTTDFLALNTRQTDNPLYYGKIYLSSDISLKGDLIHPMLSVKAKLEKGSSLTYVRPNDQLAEMESKGIIEFVDSFTLKNPVLARKGDSTQGIYTKGIELNAVVEVDNNTKLKMLLDPVSGDSLVVRGDASLNFSLDRNGKASLNGSYAVYSGNYQLSMNEFFKRNFILDKGGKITWSGDMMDAFLDLNAIYKVRTDPLALLEGQLAGMSETQKNMYRTNLDFLVYLKVKGSLEKPEISFDIQQPDDQRGAFNGSVDARLNQIRQDENEMNKQVFSLITLNSFLAEDPLNSPGGGDAVSSAVRSSASSLLSQQLNQASAKYVKGVDLNLGLESYDDYSTGQQQGRTQVKLGVSKQIFNNKLTVQVGGNVDVEGEKAKENNANEIAGNVLIEYKLTKDARYKLKAFQKSEYDPIEGELIETGMGLLFTKDYTKLKELFRIKENRKKRSNE